MSESADRAVAIVGVGAILPDALGAPAFWQNIKSKRYSITETPPERWSIEDYYDPDPSAPDKTYSKIGGWVRGYQFDWKRFRIPPKVAAAMDEGQQWAVTISAEALADYGYPERPLNTDRTGVILGTALGGEMHYFTALRVAFPEFAHWLNDAEAFGELPAGVREAILQQAQVRMDTALPHITEDTMPGELPNIVAGRVANVLNLRGPNFITDAACASSFAAVQAACEALVEHQVDAMIAGGVDRNMGPASFVKFCKIGALSATGSRPFGDGADGFVMGEGSASFLLKRLSDAQQSGDRIYAVIRGVGGSSDGKGKGITAPNPVGQVLSIQRAWENAGLDPASATLVEAHGTSTRVGDVAEVESLAAVFGGANKHSIALGSAKSNIGHLKAGAGAAGLLKTAMALHDKKLPPTLNAEKANPNIDFSSTPFYVNHNLKEWEQRGFAPRRAGVSAYGFGGTNFHLVMEEYVPGMLKSESKIHAGVDVNGSNGTSGQSPVARSGASGAPVERPLPPRGILAIGGESATQIKDKLDELVRRVESGWTPERTLPDAETLRCTERLVIDFADNAELLEKINKARKAAGFDSPQAWKALQGQGIFRGSGAAPGKVAFLFPGQGSQYANMGRDLAAMSPTVARVFAEADRVMTPILGKPLTEYIFVNANDPEAMKNTERSLMQTAITQPAVLTMDTALFLLLRDYGFVPDMAMGHSLGEYAGLIAAGIMSFSDALEASAARGAEMTRVSMDDNGWMAAVMAPYEVIEQTLKEIDGYAVAANINSYNQCVVGGASKAVEQAIELFTKKGYQAVRIPVSHAFHTKIVAPASKPLRNVLDRLQISPPSLPLVANVTGGVYPTTVEGIKDILELQIASPVQWVKGLETLYSQGVRTFVEVGPKKALKGFVDDVLVGKNDVWSLFSNHPKVGELASFNQVLCGLYAAGYGATEDKPVAAPANASTVTPATATQTVTPAMAAPTQSPALESLGQALAQALQHLGAVRNQPEIYDRNDPPAGSVVISGTGLGLPGANKPLMDPDNALRILRGEQFVDLIPERFRKDMASKRITRLVKSEDGSGSFETITETGDVIKLAGRGGAFDLAEEYGVPAKLVEALDITTQLAMAAGIDSLREAGIPLVQTYRATTKGTQLPDRWMLPEALRDETGVIFASAFPGGDRFADEMRRFYTWDSLNQQEESLEELRRYTSDAGTLREIDRRLAEIRDEKDRNPYEFDRRFIFRILAMGHSQFAEYVGARGPNTHVNAACASTAQAVALAEDWIRNGRCRRVVVVGADDVTSENLMGWIGSGFLSTGAAATDDRVEDAALPFDRRRHGTLLGMGACALLVESEDAVRERGMRGIVEVLSSETSNSAYHGTRLDVDHICDVMDRLVTSAERRFGINRYDMAQQMVFISHETFTPARGGSASAEVFALRNTFQAATPSIVVCNTKGFTGHPMGAGVEDVIAVKILEYGIVPPVPNYKEVDPELGMLNLSRGGRYPVQYALHLAAGFGSQISMTLVRRIPGALDRVDNKPLYRRWLADAAGYDRAETEVVKRVLRIVPQGAPTRTPMPSTWQYGTGPAVRAQAPGYGAAPEIAPQPMVMPSSVSSQPVPMSAPSPKPVTPLAQPPAPTRTVAMPPAEPAPQPVRTPEAPSDPRPEPTPAPQPKAVAPVPAATPASAAVDPVSARVMAVVALKTGYPQDMLDPDLDLEADLGIDTVKQAETFAAIREAFDIPAQEGIKLRDYPTLGSVIGYVFASRPDLKREPAKTQPIASTPEQAAAQPPQSPETPRDAITSADAVTETVLSVVAAKTGYPKDMLEPDLDLEADLGIDTVKQAETFAAIREAFDIPAQEGIKLRDYPTLGSVIEFVYAMRPELRQTARNSAVASAPVAPAAPQAVSPTTSQPPTQATASNAVVDKVLSVVAEKTGYPVEMLDPDLDLEADLGIDTVKQAETFAAIREAFEIPVLEGIRLRDYPTLGSVIEFVFTMRPELRREATTPAVVPTTPTPTGNGHVPSAPVFEPPPTPSAPVAAAAPKAPAAVDAVASKVLAIVAEKTGYPTEMLDLDQDLEADLGIDTVKQAETFAAVRAEFDIPVQEGLKLRDYPTLHSVIEFVYSLRPDLRSASVAVANEPTPKAVAPSAEVTSSDAVADKVLSLVAEKTGYPTEMLDLDQDLEADLGIDTVKQAETFAAVRAAFDIPVQEGLKLRDYPTLNSVIEFVYTMRPDLKPGSVSTVEAQVAPVEPVATAAVTDAVAEKVLSLVAEKTGYPTEMLDLDQDLEADLGIDTVKQAETFAAVRAAFDIPVQEGLKLRDYPTLNSVIEFVYTMRPDLQRGATQVSAPAASPTVSAVASQPVAPAVTTIGTLEDADRMPRRVPVPSLRPPLDLCKPTGVTLGERSRVVVMMDQGGVGKSLVSRLQKRGVIVLPLDGVPATEALVEQLKAWLEQGPIQGVYWLPALDVEPGLEELELAQWRELNRVRVKNLFATMRTLYDSVAGPGKFLVSATRLGGLHGYGAQGATAPLGGAVSGFSKAYNVEQGMREEGKGTLVKIVDFEVSRKTAEPADLLIDETLLDPGVVEVGYFEGMRYSVTLKELPAKDGADGMVLDKDSVFVVTGAAGGITSAIVADLAVNSQGTFYLLDLVPAPARDDENIRLFRSDKEALKRKLIDEAKGRGDKPTPASIDKIIMGIERSEAALRSVEAVETAGGTAHYYSLDLRDADAIDKVMEDVRDRHGKIDVLLHAGGLLIDRTLPNKEPQQFDLVFDVKADGFFSLIKAAQGLPIGATVSFSSVAGRFGNNGQSDYSSANDLLCKISSSMRTWRPETRGIAIDWTAWGQIGMASRGSVPQIMEALGIDMLPPESGVPTIRRELTYGGTRGEVLVAGRLGAWVAEKDPTGGLDVEKVNARLATAERPLVMVGTVTSAKLFGGIQVETPLDPEKQPFLFDHQVEPGVPWLPGVMGTEALAEVASLLAPGYSVVGVQEMTILGAFKFHRNKPQTLYLSATAQPGEDGALVAEVVLRSVFQPPKPDLPATVKEHFVGKVLLRREPLAEESVEFRKPKDKALGIDRERIYKVFFHGPAYQVIERASVDGDTATALMSDDLGPNADPANALELIAPRLVELCFQTAALWSIEKKHVMALPLGLEWTAALHQAEEANGKRLYALVRAINGGETYDAQVVDEDGRVFVTLKGYMTVAMPGETKL
jgi:acyl transferase domain-containing protein/acyl carrier protein/NAD(P)-dependent dehydrogenase (short-subunit alcohol dehydrogenase family)